MNRLLFEKTGEAVYLSHLDLMRVFQRAFKRADIMIWHSQGYSPRAYVSIALPLPVGMASRCEILDFDVEDGSVALPSLPERLNAVLPAGIRVLQAYESSRKIKHLVYLAADVTLEYDRGVPQGAADAVRALFTRPEVLVHKRTKRGEADVDIIPGIRSVEPEQISPQELVLHAVVTAMDPALNPLLLAEAVRVHLPEAAPDFARAARCEVYDANMQIFR